MRNYFEALRLDRLTPANRIKQALTATPPEQLEDEGDLQLVLSNDTWREHYRRVHLQYDAIAATLSNPAIADSEFKPGNAHKWDKRVVEFVPEQNTIELSK